MVRMDRQTRQRGRQYLDDRRGQGGGSRRRVGGGRAVGGGAAGLGGMGLVLFLILQSCSGNSFQLDPASYDASLENAGPIDASGGVASGVNPDDETVDYILGLMADIQDTWAEYFDQAGLNYRPAQFSPFVGSVNTNGCGPATSAVGPFYCPHPNDENVYLDTQFFDQLATDFGAPGDFAQAYVIAHEIGHHIQAITGISEQVRAAQAQDPGNRNEYAIRLELQADCFAGVWAYSANQRTTSDGLPIIEPNDINEGIAAAKSVGDDAIQSKTTGYIDPAAWTHGSSEQRVRWFTRGFETGDPEQCDAFGSDNP